MRAAFGGERAVHDREGAFGIGAGDRRGEGEVRAKPMVARAVVELVRDTEEPFTGSQLQHGRDRDRDGLVAPRVARSGVADRVLGPRVVGVDLHSRAHRSASSVVTRTASGVSITRSLAGGE